MFFVLSKLLNFLIQPLFIVALLLLLSLVIRKPKLKRIFLITGFINLLFFSNDFIANEVVTWWELPTQAYKEMRAYEAAVLLTGVAQHKNTGPTDRVYISTGADRVNHTVELYKRGIIKEIIISGGISDPDYEGTPEAILLRDLMKVMSVPDSVIWLDPYANNTYENAVNSKVMMDSLQLQPKDCLLVTSAFHMRRALACFNKQNIAMDYFTCDFRSRPRTFKFDTLLIPKLEAILIWQKLLKEWVGILAYKMAGYV
ncbi:YdcF family protein [Chryseotalea sanaruensis]|uniref:YdcF family protein n=1 Tax=Chryseotalea sanaruensis TaxID=2482724 RepID=A0A401UDY0_9BACT|nr:YdcF family protein [Chryseotalea sanaruensis]GCC53080.1 YdcF family protein [Chryseotalea sanaruensis]